MMTTRYLLIASGVLITAVILLYVLVFRPARPHDDSLARLAEAAERMCLSNTTSGSSATIRSQLEAVKGLHAWASVDTGRQETRGALASLSATLKTEQDDKIRGCMQPYTDKMLSLVH